ATRSRDGRLGMSPGSAALAEHPVHLRPAHRAGALSGLATVGELDLTALEFALLTALDAVALVLSHASVWPQSGGKCGILDYEALQVGLEQERPPRYAGPPEELVAGISDRSGRLHGADPEQAGAGPGPAGGQCAGLHQTGQQMAGLGEQRRPGDLVEPVVGGVVQEEAAVAEACHQHAHA